MSLKCHWRAGLIGGTLLPDLAMRTPSGFTQIRERNVMDREAKPEEREEAWTATKLAVREYSRDPTSANAERVEAACLRLRNLPESGQAMPIVGAKAHTRSHLPHS